MKYSSFMYQKTDTVYKNALKISDVCQDKWHFRALCSLPERDTLEHRDEMEKESYVQVHFNPYDLCARKMPHFSVA